MSPRQLKTFAALLRTTYTISRPDREALAALCDDVAGTADQSTYAGGMSTDLGPLPDTPFGLFHESPGDDDSEGWQEFIDAPGYTADQMRAERERCYAFGVARERERRSEEMRAYAAAEVAREREACARICDVTPPQPFRPSIEAAHAIRKRATQDQT